MKEWRIQTRSTTIRTYVVKADTKTAAYDKLEDSFDDDVPSSTTFELVDIQEDDEEVIR